MNELDRLMKLAGVHRVKDNDRQQLPKEWQRFTSSMLEIMKDELENVAGRQTELSDLGDLNDYNAVLYYGYKGQYIPIQRIANGFGVAARNRVWKALFDSGVKDPHNMHL